MPVATAEKNGLMSKTDKKYGINRLYLSNGSLIKLCSVIQDWERAAGTVFYGDGTNIALYYFTYVRKSSTSYYVKVKALIDINIIEFYIKEDALYLYFKESTGLWANIIGYSTTSFTNMGKVGIDDTYTKVTIK